jgi:hypothetical protein
MKCIKTMNVSITLDKPQLCIELGFSYFLADDGETYDILPIENETRWQA